LKVMGRSSIEKVEVRADGIGLSSRAGTALLPLVAQRLGLTDALGWALGETRERRSAHDPGRVFCDLAVMLADGGRCVSDLVALGSQQALFGDVASVSTARRVLLSVGEAELDRLRAARARAAAARHPATPASATQARRRVRRCLAGARAPRAGARAAVRSPAPTTRASPRRSARQSTTASRAARARSASLRVAGRPPASACGAREPAGRRWPLAWRPARSRRPALRWRRRGSRQQAGGASASAHGPRGGRLLAPSRARASSARRPRKSPLQRPLGACVPYQAAYARV